MRPELPVLIKARAKIADPANWGKGRRIANRPRHTCCLAEAIEETECGDDRHRSRAFDAIKAVIGVPYLTHWNDKPERTHAEVLAAFDRAIAKAGGSSETPAEGSPE